MGKIKLFLCQNMENCLYKNHLLINAASLSIMLFHFYHESFVLFLLKSPSISDVLLYYSNWINISFTPFLTSAEPSMIMLFITFTILMFSFNIWQSYYFFYKILSMQSATFTLIGMAFALLFVIIIAHILVVVQ